MTTYNRGKVRFRENQRKMQNSNSDNYFWNSTEK